MVTEFEEEVYKKLKLVPKGKITTYKDLAIACNSFAFRAVGSAMRKNPNIPSTPCHRVINSNGEIGGYAGGDGVKSKIEILEKEGIKVKSNKVIDFKKYLYKFENE